MKNLNSSSTTKTVNIRRTVPRTNDPVSRATVYLKDSLRSELDEILEDLRDNEKVRVTVSQLIRLGLELAFDMSRKEIIDNLIELGEFERSTAFVKKRKPPVSIKTIHGVDYKECTHCHELLKLNAFRRRVKSLPRLHSWCINCINSYNRGLG